MDGLVSAITSVISFLAIITVLVFVHELGHYAAARRIGARIEVFSIGLGRELLGWTDRHGTCWRLGWIPLGGYIKMFGDADAASTPSATLLQMTDSQKAVAFHHKRLIERVAVTAAGPLANLAFGFVLIAVLLMLVGKQDPATDAGPIAAAMHQMAVVLGNAIQVTWDLSTGTLQAVWQMVTGMRPAQELVGPVRAAALSGGVAQAGILPLLLLMAIFSVNLGVVNLLPVPVLDGGHLVFLGLEAIRGKRVGVLAQKHMSRVGMAMVLGTMVFSISNDLLQMHVLEFVRHLVT